VLFQQRVEKVLPVAEIRAFQPIKGIHQVNQAALCGQIENAKRSGDFESHTQCDGRAFAVIDEDEIGLEGETERNG
jgi:hypothetical protein